MPPQSPNDITQPEPGTPAHIVRSQIAYRKIVAVAERVEKTGVLTTSDSNEIAEQLKKCSTAGREVRRTNGRSKAWILRFLNAHREQEKAQAEEEKRTREAQAETDRLIAEAQAAKTGSSESTGGNEDPSASQSSVSQSPSICECENHETPQENHATNNPA